MNEQRVAIYRSGDRWCVVSDNLPTDWIRSRRGALALAYQRIGGPKVPHALKQGSPGMMNGASAILTRIHPKAA